LVKIGSLLDSSAGAGAWRPSDQSSTDLPEPDFRARSGLGAFHNAALRILAAHELEEALGGVTQEARSLLESDIAGVMLRSGDMITMRGCVGHHRSETSRLVMGRGQGLAGLVFATGRPSRTDNYLESTTISPDFQSLARLEGTRCALGAPILLKGDIIGVLEVWRRTAAAYDDTDTEHLVALADLAAIAIDNARLIESNARSLAQVEDANERLAWQLDRVDRALALQHQLIDDLLNRRRVKELMCTLAAHAGRPVALLDRDHDVIAGSPGVSGELVAEAASLLARHKGGLDPDQLQSTTTSAAVHAVRIGDELTGWLAVGASTDVARTDLTLVLTQGALACALAQLQERAASEARAAMREDVLLNLLTGSESDRQAAVARARQLGIELKGPLRVCVAFIGLRVDTTDSLAGVASADSLRRQIMREIEQILLEQNVSRSLSALRGDAGVVLTRSDAPQLRPALVEVAKVLTRRHPGTTIRWGVSAARTRPMELGDASHEASTALQIARTSAASSVALFDELGIVGLVLSGPQGSNLQEFVARTIGALVEHDRDRGSQLVLTLRTWLDCNCSQSETAEALFVHAKTIKYRLDQVCRLTDLDLGQHKDRLRADLAIRTADLI
jgi:sugar diacid utilization regulator/putative methionine-R-sulfoxide reductase with GAF domain